ncbi:MAG: outer membrane protein assembly factor BamD [Bdellovibrionales bacterium]|nr:outer membrane protein assembly factor BamD [Bdellovibrionales bacterium]
MQSGNPWRLGLHLILCLSLILAAGSVVGCSGKAVNEDDPQSVYEDAEDDIENDRYLIALEKLRKIRHKFPYSKFSSKAQLRIADVLYLQESFAEAAQAYESFRDLHPKHDDTPYATFRVGESYAMDAPENIARDLTSDFRALDAFQEFTRKYPNDKRSEEAKGRIQTLRNKVASKEFEIAEFYRVRDFPGSAGPRYRKILDLYPDTTWAKEAKARLAESGDTQQKKEGRK